MDKSKLKEFRDEFKNWAICGKCKPNEEDVYEETGEFYFGWGLEIFVYLTKTFSIDVEAFGKSKSFEPGDYKGAKRFIEDALAEEDII